MSTVLLTCCLPACPPLAEEGSESKHALQPADAAAILRCATSAARLPAMSYGLLCNRLHRSFTGAAGAAEVEQSLAAFAAAHGGQQQYQLGPYVAELLSRHGLESAEGSTQLQLLRLLPQLLLALPETEAARLLPVAVQHVSTTRRGSKEHRRQLLLQLLQALAGVLATGSVGGPSGPSAIQTAAAGAVEDVLLLPGLMPPPGQYPLQLGAIADAAAAGAGREQLARLPALQQRCWASALRCLQLLPAPQRDALLQHSALLPSHAAYAAACLVASGQVDSRALQHPRNLVLQGCSRSDSSSSGSAQGHHAEHGQEQDDMVAVALHVGRAVATLAGGQQQQWLLDVLDACKASREGRAVLGGAHAQPASCKLPTIHLLLPLHACCAGCACCACCASTYVPHPRQAGRDCVRSLLSRPLLARPPSPLLP